MHSREPFAYVVAVEGRNVKLNLFDVHRGHVAAHSEGVAAVTDVGGLFGVDAGAVLLILRVSGLSFAEPREAHARGVGTTSTRGEPLRHLDAAVIGRVDRFRGVLRFTADSLASPTLGAEAFPLSFEESASILGQRVEPGIDVKLGLDVRGGGPLVCGLTQLLSRHVAVLGGTGQGKSCFTAAVLQQLLTLPSPRIVVFDINGEYDAALRPAVPPKFYKQSALGGPSATMRIPYYALGRHGLSRLLLPSEKTQRPALAFALEQLNKVLWFPGQGGAGPVGASNAALFDDGRPGDATPAWNAIDDLRKGRVGVASEWPHMNALGCLIAESHALKQSQRGGLERDSFHYGNVSPLITRLRRCVEDPLFESVVDVRGGKPTPGASGLSWQAEGTALCEQVFGGPASDWHVHVVNLRHVAHDLMPLILGSLLELFAFELFRRGQEGTHPTLLVLEEAHHYLRQFTDASDDPHGALAYERLAKEGRKFGLGLWVSTQRPCEVSATVLAQCGTWVVFRLTSEQDLRAVAAAGQWADKHDLTRISGLPRREAIVFGSSISIPVRVVTPEANPLPLSSDPPFDTWATAINAGGPAEQVEADDEAAAALPAEAQDARVER